ncbi:hypothetical protein FAI41_03535 [Acetobacteraceae bacterium]|nr:hypothetical protein FAI41_03535 [Acetobacteraceae bacterium]
MTAKNIAPKPPKKRQNTSNVPKPRKGRKTKPTIPETLEEIPFLSSEVERKKSRKKPLPVKEKAGKEKEIVPVPNVPFQKDNLPVLSQKVAKTPVLKESFPSQNFESYCLSHWGRINLYFFLPASISPPLLGLWLTPAGMTAGFAILVFMAVLGIANCLSFLLILLVWAFKGNR